MSLGPILSLPPDIVASPRLSVAEGSLTIFVAVSSTCKGVFVYPPDHAIMY